MTATWLDMFMLPNQTLQIQASQLAQLVAFTAHVSERHGVQGLRVAGRGFAGEWWLYGS